MFFMKRKTKKKNISTSLNEINAIKDSSYEQRVNVKDNLMFLQKQEKEQLLFEETDLVK